MRTNFNILWVEDQPGNVNAQLNGIKSRLNNEGFRLREVFANNAEEAHGYISNDLYADNVDLILMDYNLGEDSSTGDEVIRRLRETLKYKEVIFYSARDVESLTDALQAHHLEGVFCCHRSELPDTVVEIFNVLVKKTMDLNHSRGLILGMVCEIEELIKTAISEKFKSSGEHKTKIIDRINEEKERNMKRAEDIMKNLQLDDVESFEDIEKIRDSRSILTSHLMAGVLLKVVDKDTDAYRSIDTFMKRSIPIRNDFAHLSTEDKEAFVSVFKDRNGTEITKGDLKEIRKLLLGQIEILEEL